MSLKIAVILPQEANDMLGDMVIDGLATFPNLDVAFQKGTGCTLPKEFVGKELPEKEFISWAQNADLIFLIWGKRKTNTELADAINKWEKTIFIDGAEVGKDRRYDAFLHSEELKGNFNGNGRIHRDILSKAALYFKREKPYRLGVIPLPFGIERRHIAYKPGLQKDIDFFCVFGQEDFPIMRKHARELLEDFCKKNSFTCHTQKTKSKEEFYSLLARSKVGISIGGGGYDTARFWETLANNCILLTEKIDIYEPESTALKYERIKEFNNLYDLEYWLEKVGKELKSGYSPEALESEYEKILEQHSSHARVKTILSYAVEKGIISSYE